MSRAMIWNYGEEKVIGHGIAQGRQQQYGKSKRREKENLSSGSMLAFLRAKSTLFFKYTIIIVLIFLGKSTCF